MIATALCSLLLTVTQTWQTRTFSVYSPQLHGSQLASRGRYNRNKFTCASNTHKLGTVLELEYKGRRTKVIVNDRMAKRFTHTRIDLSSAAFKLLYPKYNISSIRSMQRTETIIQGKFRILESGIKSKTKPLNQ